MHSFTLSACFYFLTYFFFFFFKQSGFNSGHLINQTQTICCSPVSCWSALPEVSDMFQGCSLTLSLPLSAVLLQICSFHPTHSDWALFTVMTIYDSRSARQFVSKYRTCAKASYTTNCCISMKIRWTKKIMASQRNIHYKEPFTIQILLVATSNFSFLIVYTFQQ